jgi:hypothetical protein
MQLIGVVLKAMGGNARLFDLDPDYITAVYIKEVGPRALRIITWRHLQDLFDSGLVHVLVKAFKEKGAKAGMSLRPGKI